MEGKVSLVLATLLACTAAASIGGFASFGPLQAFASGGFNFQPPRIPFLPSFGSNSSANSTSNSTSSLFGPFAPFLDAVPGLSGLVSGSGLLSGMPAFPDIGSLVSRIPGIGSNRNGTDRPSVTVPPFSPTAGFNQGPYIPFVSEALGEARRHLVAALNITSDFSSGMRKAVQVALDSDRPVESVGVILNTIAKVYSTVAANCPLIVVGHRVFAEGVRLAFEVARSISNVVVGTDVVG